jgi:short-subunit dehydrogenase
MHVAVTGASSGIGEAIVREYVRRGARVTMVARRRELLERIAHDAGGETHIVQADLSDVEHACDWLAPAEKMLGPIDVLVNNAGVQIVAPVTSTDWSRAEAMLRLNLLTPLRLTHAVLPAMIARKSGCIVDVASSAAFGPPPGMYFYSASKGALGAASEGLRNELRGTGVHVVTVYPGAVESPMETAGRAAYVPSLTLKLFPSGKADVLARLIAEAVEHRKSRVIYPRLVGLGRHLPNATHWFLARFTPRLKLPDRR